MYEYKQFIKNGFIIYLLRGIGYGRNQHIARAANRATHC